MREQINHPSILALATHVPTIPVTGEAYLSFVTQLLNLDATQSALVARFVTNSMINRRYTVVQDFITPPDQWTFFDHKNSSQLPDTQRRNEVYKKNAPELAYSAAKKALSQWGQSSNEITHIIFVSCTGLMAPGIECLLINKLGLSKNVQRTAINFMGCFGAFRALALAQAMAQQNSNHRILIVCTELCSLHIQPDMNLDTIISNAIFGDGSAAMIIGAYPRNTERPLWDIINCAASIVEFDSTAMSWDISNNGFVMRLAHDVPQHIKNNIHAFAQSVVAQHTTLSECDWAVHPGGKAILQAVEQACALSSDQTKSSWDVHAGFGNMSSATFPFVLEHLRPNQRKQYTLGLGFGPGLSTEGVLLKNVFNE